MRARVREGVTFLGKNQRAASWEGALKKKLLEMAATHWPAKATQKLELTSTLIQAPMTVVIIPIQKEIVMLFEPMSQLAGKVKTKLKIIKEEVKKFATDPFTPYS